MPIEKLEVVRKTDTDPSSTTLNILMQRQLCCSECGETQFTLRRVRDENNRKVRPARYVCMECYKRNG